MFVLQNIFVSHNFPNVFLAINWEYIHLFWTNPEIRFPCPVYRYHSWLKIQPTLAIPSRDLGLP